MMAIGTIKHWRGSTYELAEVKPYRCVDGRDSFVLIWFTRCATCNASLEVRTGLEFKGPVRRCRVHRHRGKRVTKRELLIYSSGFKT
jgi:hypothetical protein